MLNRFLSNPQNFPPMIEDPGMVVPPNVAMAGAGAGGVPGSYQGQATVSSTAEESKGSSWFGGFFGGKKEDAKSSGSSAKTEVLESFDVPSVPSFEYK